MAVGSLSINLAPAHNHHYVAETRSGVDWLVARNYTIRFEGVLRLPNEELSINGVYLAVENAMLPLSNDDILGYSHGVVTVYNDQNLELLSGPFLKPVFGMRLKNGQLRDWWTEVMGSWSGSHALAGRLVRVQLKGIWQDPTLIESGEIEII